MGGCLGLAVVVISSPSLTAFWAWSPYFLGGTLRGQETLFLRPDLASQVLSLRAQLTHILLLNLQNRAGPVWSPGTHASLL